MLTASVSAPNTRQQKAQSAPTPDNWFGVAEGMDRAKKAIACGELEQAAQILMETVEFAPSETAAWKLLARIQRKLGHLEAGITSATRALQLQHANPQPEPPASPILAKLLWQQDEKKQAMKMLTQLIERDPTDHALLSLQQDWAKESVS